MIELLNDSLPAENPYDSLATCYELGYFQDDSLLHNATNLPAFGIDAMPLSSSMWNNEWTAILAFVAFLLFVLLIKRNRRTFNTQIMDFFFPSREVKSPKADDKSDTSLSRILSLVLISLLGGIGTFIYTQLQTDTLFGHLVPCFVIIGIYAAAWLVYFIAKNLLYSFVNWIFFDKRNRESWYCGQTFLLSTESVLFFPVLIIALYTTISVQISIWIALSIIVISKILLLYKTLVIFFAKTYGGLHLFVYFCTLEVIPLLVFIKLLTNVPVDTLVKL